MDTRTLRNGQIGAASVPLATASVGYVLLPVYQLAVRGFGTTSSANALGLEQFAVLSAHSVFYALVPAIAASAICLWASCWGLFFPRFDVAYRVWLRTMLFTNPVFFVFGFSVLLANVQPTVAVLVASSFIVIPICGQLIQTSIDSVDSQLLQAARSLGANPFEVCRRHLLPGCKLQIVVSVLLTSVFAFGFFLTPTFVGLGRITTFGTLIYDLTNATGDVHAAARLSLQAMCVEGALIACAMLAFRTRAKRGGSNAAR